MSAPTRRRPHSRRRAVQLLAASGLALVGVLTLAVVWLGLGVNALRLSATGDVPCLASQTTDDARLAFELLPARAVCVHDVEGQRQEVVLASAPTAVVVGGIVLAVGGITGTVLVLRADRRRTPPPAPDVPSDRPAGAVGAV